MIFNRSLWDVDGISWDLIRVYEMLRGFQWDFNGIS
jgi:hypothetical protein